MSDPRIVWVNGDLVRAGDVRVSPFDLGVTVGLGVFETMPSYEGRVFALKQHHERMKHSMLALFGPDFPRVEVPPLEVLEVAVRDVMDQNNLTQGRSRVRMSLSAGENPLSGGDRPGNLMITAVPLPEPDPSQVVTLGISPYLWNESGPLAGVKSSSFADPLTAWREGLRAGVDEVVRMNVAGKVSECAMSNLFLVKGKVVMTPDLASGCLPGVTRAMVLELCDDLGLTPVTCTIEKEALHQVDEIFITSSIREVQAAEMKGGNRTHGGLVTQMIADVYRNRVRRELGL